ncbi:hypothetical protein CY34DRAFT_416186 [Suillus luteus UH-Slu-Lm8-n1]|uniref:Uncharacterized protein n=1 Tax=Suillus luteus UH-Slu-Lm8-n1 TaxID=930992 RepID=A0A0D0AUM6_9AGAM|nr:hypothetical protein CY34DRAFT_416186 [Suillus luteus UH-Slu-Lm8-n1]
MPNRIRWAEADMRPLSSYSSHPCSYPFSRTNMVQRSRFWSKEVGSSLCAKYLHLLIFSAGLCLRMSFEPSKLYRCSCSCFLLPMKLITKATVLMWPSKAATYCKTSATRDNIYMLHHSIQSMISPGLRLRGSAAKSIPNDGSGEVQVLANRLQF